MCLLLLIALHGAASLSAAAAARGSSAFNLRPRPRPNFRRAALKLDESAAEEAEAEVKALVEEHTFPTIPAFLVPVEVRGARSARVLGGIGANGSCASGWWQVREVPRLGAGQRGVFATADIAAGTPMWVWTHRVVRIHHSQLDEHITSHFGTDAEAIRIFLRQGFVLPGEEGEDDFFNSNPTDAGRFVNHSPTPSCGPAGTLRNVAAGEELTMAYSFHADPAWYRAICAKHDVQTEAQVAATYGAPPESTAR